jgi:hypothetical protein
MNLNKINWTAETRRVPGNLKFAGLSLGWVSGGVLGCWLIFGGSWCDSFSARAFVPQDVETAEQTEEGPAVENPPPQEETLPRIRLELPAADAPYSQLSGVISRYQADRQILERYWSTPQSTARQERFRQFLGSWLEGVQSLDSSEFSELTRRDYHRLLEQIYTKMAENEGEAASQWELAPLLPFRNFITPLIEAKSRVEPVKAVALAEQMVEIEQLLNRLNQSFSVIQQGVAVEREKEIELEGGRQGDGLSVHSWRVNRLKRGIEEIASLRRTLRAWFTFYDSYDPLFSWWVSQPYQGVDRQLEAFQQRIEKSCEGLDDNQSLAFQLADWSDRLRGASAETPFLSRELLLDDVPDLPQMMKLKPSRLEGVIGQFFDSQARRRQGTGSGRGRGTGLSRQRLEEWKQALAELDFDSLDLFERVDYILLNNRIQYNLKRLALGGSGGEMIGDESGIRGRAIGREALLVELANEMIPYEPEELIEIANRELAWCRRELVQAATELGFGEDWRAAVEHVKTLHVNPGEQPYLVRQLSDEAVNYLRDNQLLTIPPLANETWRMRMMPPEQQLVTPFFTGGEVVTVSFPTSEMPHDAKIQSLRGNNIHFSRATVHHELIPGHGLQAFMSSRYRTYRAPLGTPFWTEGWALYWEMILYERGFPATPEDRIGFLVWRSHRCARIVFSLRFHLGWMTPRECVDFLVENVGFERMGAEGEVRRSFGGSYPPLYQAAYMLGGLQFRSLHETLVKSGRLSDREFHDRILQEGRIPVELIRAILMDEKPSRDFQPSWRFYDLSR